MALQEKVALDMLQTFSKQFEVIGKEAKKLGINFGVILAYELDNDEVINTTVAAGDQSIIRQSFKHAAKQMKEKQKSANDLPDFIKDLFESISSKPNRLEARVRKSAIGDPSANVEVIRTGNDEFTETSRQPYLCEKRKFKTEELEFSRDKK